MPSWISPPPPPPEHPLIRSYNSLKARISGITSLPPSAIDILLPSITAATATLTLVYLYRNFLKRYPDSNSLPPQFFRRKGLYGKIHIRIAGVDAPEGAHFGKPSQPHSSESLSYLSNLLTSHNVRAHLLRRDQYERVVCSVSMKRKGILGLLGFKHDVGLLMLKAGMAQVYEGTYGIEFGKRQGMEEKYRAAEEEARAKKLGIWGLKGKYESPGQYKARFGGKEGPFTPSTAIADKGKESTGEKVKGKRGVSSSSAAVKLKVETRGRKRKAPSAATATTVAKNDCIFIFKEQHLQIS
ncbi:putative endonuclease lcl3 [Orbilia oligospora]|nr:putative endonuclease lcl3 [Orbilia oligospora]